MNKNNIIFIGYMGVGKGVLARALSKKTSLFAIDTDDLIESIENDKIKKIFKKHGEEYFRKKEQICANWLEKSVNNTIISAGGGFYKVNNLKKIGYVIYLKLDFEHIIKRIKSHPNAKAKIKKRPLLLNEEKAKKLYVKRAKEYEKKANLTIDAYGKNTEEIIKEILKHYKGLKKWAKKPFL